MQFARTVILVDDDLDDHEVFKSACMVVDPTIEVIGFESGEQALRGLSTFEIIPDMIFLDLNMPRLNGIEVLEAVKAMENMKVVPVIVYTTFFDTSVKERCQKIGAADVIEKPNSFDALCEKTGRASQGFGKTGSLRNCFIKCAAIPSMNKRLFFIYTTVFVLTGLMLYLYRASYRDMKVFIEDVNRMSAVVVKLERLDALLHFWLNNDRTADKYVELYLSPDDAYDSVLYTAGYIKDIALFQEDRLRMDTIRLAVRDFQSLNERSDTVLTQNQKESFRRNLKGMLESAFLSANTRLEHSKLRLTESTALLDKWLVWMLILAGSLITIATFYSFSFLRQRQKAEGFNRALLDITNNGMISFQPVFNHDGIIENFRVTYCNEAGLNLLNLKDWRGIMLTGILPPKVQPDVRKVFDSVLDSKRSEIVEGYLQHEQERKWLQAMVTPLDRGLFVSIYNLTPEKTYQQRLTNNINQLKILNDELQQYAYVTSHDLQEPLRKIQMFSDIAINLQSEEEGKTKDDYFRRIQGIASHMRELIQTLLAFSRSTDQPVNLERVDLNAVLNEVVEELDIRDTRASIDLPDLPKVEGSRLHLKLLFSNLLTNAVKYAKHDVPLRIKILERKAAHPDYIAFPVLDQLVSYTRITVADNGVGFQSHFSEKVFTIFQRLYNKESAHGTGIGLAICKKIVHQHNGHMYAEAIENEGASFHIFLPLQQPAESD